MIDQRQTSICFVEQNQTYGGSVQSCLDIIEALSAKHIKTILVVNSQCQWISRIPPSVYCYRVYAYPWVKHSNVPSSWLRPFFRIIKSAVNFYSSLLIELLLWQHSCRLVHINTILYGLMAHKGYIFHYDTIFNVREAPLEGHSLNYLYPQKTLKFLRQSNRVIVTSNFLYNKLPSLVKHNTAIIPNGFEPNSFTDTSSYRLRSDTITCSMIGRICPEKGNHIALSALANISSQYDIKMILYGEVSSHSYLNSLEQIALQGNIKLHYAGFAQKTKSCYENTDLVIICCMEGFGRVTVEAMLSGCIVIGPDAGATPEIISNQKTGFIYKYNSVSSLTRSLLSAISNQTLSRQLASQAVLTARSKYNKINTMNSFLAEYKRLGLSI